MPSLDVRLHQLHEPGLDDVEGVLAVPERVVGVEPDHVEPSGHRDESGADAQVRLVASFRGEDPVRHAGASRRFGGRIVNGGSR